MERKRDGNGMRPFRAKRVSADGASILRRSAAYWAGPSGCLELLARVPSIRRSAPLTLAVFLVGAGIGAAIIALGHGGRPRRVVVKHVVVKASPPATGKPPAAGQATRPASRTTAKPHGVAVVPPGAAASFDALAAQLGGEVGLAVAPLGQGQIHTFGSLAAGHAWSTMKVPVLVTLLASYARHGQALSAQQQEKATLALERSDNAAAEALFADLEQIYGGLVPASGAVQQTLSDAGDTTTTINTAPNNEGFTTWGQSIWSTAGEVIFYRALAAGCLLEQNDTRYVLKLMSSVIPSQRWGAGSAGYPPGVPLAFKAGWGPENGGGYLVRQTAIVGSGTRGYVVSMIALPPDGSFSQGTNMIAALATWARQHLVQATRPPDGCASLP